MIRAGKTLRYLVFSCLFCVIGATSADGDQERRYDIDVQVTDAEQALKQLAAQTESLLLFPFELAENTRVQPVTGRYTIEQALELLLADSGLAGVHSNHRVISVTRVNKPDNGDENMQTATKKPLLRRIVTGLAGALFATSGTGAIAADQADKGSTTERASGVFEEVVVTARRREETAQNVPIPITALSGEQLETRNMWDLTDIERLSPNTDIFASANNASAMEVYIRGIGQRNWSETQDQKIGIYTDGVYLSRPQGGLLDFMDVERVEVLRGPQGTLFGKNTTAGLIHIISNKPTQQQEIDVRGGVGTNGHHTVGLTYNQPLTDTLAARFALFSKKTDGFIINSITGNDRGNENSLSYRLSLSWDLGNYSALFIHDHFEADERPDLATCRFTGPENSFEAGGLAFLANIFGIYDKNKANCRAATRDVSIDTSYSEDTTSDVDGFNLTQSYEFGLGEFVSVTSYREIDNFNGSWGWVNGNGPDANYLEILDNASDNKIFSQEFRLTGGTDNFDWVVGAYSFKEKNDGGAAVVLFRDVPAPSREEWPFFYTPIGTNPDGSEQILGDIAVGVQTGGSRVQRNIGTHKNWALFAEGTYGLTDQLDLTVGARYTKDKREFTRVQNFYGGAFDPAYFCPGMPTVEVDGVVISASDRCTQDVDYDEITPRVILAYQLNDDVMIYGSYSVGYSSGGFNQDTRMRPFQPEISDNFEIGTKSMLFDDKLRFNATVFHNTYENQQLSVARVVDGQPISDLINAQQATLQGIEIEILAQLTGSLSMTFSGGYFEGDYDEFTVDDNTFDPMTLEEIIVTRDLSDIEFGNNGDSISMDFSFLHQASFEFGDITSSLGFTYKDDIYYSLLNTPSSKVDGYWVSDARITWHLTNGQTSVSLWSTNLGDEEYVTAMLNQAGDTEIGGTDPGLGMVADYWGDPRRFGLEVRHSF